MIEKITIKNFKAIRSATIKLTDISVFIGNNGSGKSSVIEALQMLQNTLNYGLSVAFQNRWFGFEYICNDNTTYKSDNVTKFKKDIEIKIEGTFKRERYTYEICFNTSSNGDLFFITYESLFLKGKGFILGDKRNKNKKPEPQTEIKLSKNNNSFSIDFRNYILSWQFLTLEPERMYFPTQRNYSTSIVRMKNSGENLADFLRRLLDKPELGKIIIDKLHYVLPDLDYVDGEEIAVQKLIYLFLKEKNNEHRIPSWLFSSGTLRILAMLSILNSETPPPIVFIEEIENGLDPRTLNLLVAEIRGMLSEHQFVVTSHSPYFLDLVDLRHVIVAERNESKTSFYRPDDDKSFDDWKEEFSAGTLYTMNKFSRQ
jgi:predicted ATPase